MAVAAMKRLEVVASRADKYALLNYLQETGVTEIHENAELAESLAERELKFRSDVIDHDLSSIQGFTDLTYILHDPESADHLYLSAISEELLENLLQESSRWQSRIAAALKALQPYDFTKKPLFSNKRVRSLAEREATFADQARLLEVVTTVEEAVDARRSAEESLSGMMNHLGTLEPLKEIQLPEQIAKGKLRSTSGFFKNQEEYDRLMEAAREANLALAGDIYYRTEDKLIAILAWPFSEDDRVRRVMSESVMQSFPAASEAEKNGNFREAYKDLEERIEDTRAEIVAAEEVLKEQVSEIPKLEELSDILTADSNAYRADLETQESQNLVFVSGYVPATVADDLKAKLTDKFKLSVQMEDPVVGDEEVPTYLMNPEPLRPVESILTTFSPPHYFDDVDPSPIMAFTYAFFFGSMLSDIGYGGLLLIGCLLGLFKFKAEGGMRKMLWVFAAGGTVAIIFGVLYGSFFGNMLPEVTGGRVTLPVFWFDPMNDPITLMIWSMVFGAIHLFIALGLDIYNKFRLGQKYEALFSVAPWYLIIGGVGLLVLGVPFAMWVIIAGAAIILLMSSKEKNPIKRLIAGLLSLYNVTSWLSDLLSYTRILALTLATSVIAMVVNMMAAMAGGGGGFKVLFLILVLLVGHALNIALSTLSAYVHATRLHYVEFLGKFYNGGGRLFQPLNKEGQYTRVEEPNSLFADIRRKRK